MFDSPPFAAPSSYEEAMEVMAEGGFVTILPAFDSDGDRCLRVVIRRHLSDEALDMAHDPDRVERAALHIVFAETVREDTGATRIPDIEDYA